jgi:peptidoglycan/xylan/chitin deacetylase (PgdA/CDA1 family)
MRPFVVCIHDATPAHTLETEAMIRSLAPLVGRRISVGVVPDWHGAWPLAAHPDYCRLIQENSEEILLHGYFHRRQRGWGPTSFLAERCDEMNGLDAGETRRTLERGQRVFVEAFGQPARGFLAPGWQRGHVRAGRDGASGQVEHVLGFFSLESASGRRIPLATWTWDCGRWGFLGHLGHGIGSLRHALGRGVPVLAIHPRDISRGYWPGILRLAEALLERRYVPSTLAGLLEPSDAEIAV